MSNYDLDLDYVFPRIDGPAEEYEAKYDEIIREADRIIAENTANNEDLARAYLKKAQCLRKFEIMSETENPERRAEIRKYAEKALELSPDMPEALQLMGNIYKDYVQDKATAVDYYTRAITAKPDYAMAFHNRAIATIEDKNDDSDKAINDYSRAIQLNPDCAVFFFNRGQVYYSLHEYDKAIADYSEAIRLRPDVSKFFEYRGYAYYQKKDKDKATADVHEAMSIAENSNSASELTQIRLYIDNENEKKEKMAKIDNAISELSEAIDSDENSNTQKVKLFADRGKAHWQKEDMDKAIADLSEAIKSSENSNITNAEKAELFGCRGQAYFNQQNCDKAIIDFSEVIRLQPDNSKGYQCRAEVYEQKKEYEKELSDFNEIIRLNPKNGIAYGYRGKLYRLMGDHDKAESDMAEMLRLECATSFHPFLTSFLPAKIHNSEVILVNDSPPPIFPKCSFCGLPGYFVNASYKLTEDQYICKKCFEDKTLIEKIVSKDKNLYPRIDEIRIGQKEMDKISRLFSDVFSEMGWVERKIMLASNFTFDELRTRAQEFRKPKSVEIDGIAIHKNQNAMPIEGEVFKKNEQFNIEASNFGRIRDDTGILPQYDSKKNGYLFVDIKGTDGKTTNEKVYRLTASAWCEQPENHWEDSREYSYYIVHHINNNGYDNRVENLMWVTASQHAMIHPWINLDELNNSELDDLLSYYKKIHITPNDYQRILDIAKKIQKTGAAVLGYDDICGVIEAMEALIKK